MKTCVGSCPFFRLLVKGITVTAGLFSDTVLHMRIIVRFRQVDKPEFQSGATDAGCGHGFLRVQMLDVVHLFALLIKIFLESKTTCRLFFAYTLEESATKCNTVKIPACQKTCKRVYWSCGAASCRCVGGVLTCAGLWEFQLP